MKEHKRLPKSSHNYLNPSHLGPSTLFTKIIQDSEEFTLDELKEICSSQDIDPLIKTTTLFMIGSKWNSKSINSVYEILIKNSILCEYVDDLFTSYASIEAKEIVNKLYKQSLITKSKSDFLTELIEENIKYNRDPAKIFGIAKYKE